MTGYQKLKEQIENIEHERDFNMSRATAYTFGLLQFVPEEKREECGLLIKRLLKDRGFEEVIASLDPVVAMFVK